MQGCGRSGPGEDSYYQILCFSIYIPIIMIHIEEYLCFPVTVLWNPKWPEFIFMEWLEGRNDWERGNWEPRNYSSSSWAEWLLFTKKDRKTHPYFLCVKCCCLICIIIKHQWLSWFCIWHYIFIQWAFIDCLLCARKSSWATKRQNS